MRQQRSRTRSIRSNGLNTRACYFHVLSLFRSPARRVPLPHADLLWQTRISLLTLRLVGLCPLGLHCVGDWRGATENKKQFKGQKFVDWRDVVKKEHRDSKDLNFVALPRGRIHCRQLKNCRLPSMGILVWMTCIPIFYELNTYSFMFEFCMNKRNSQIFILKKISFVFGMN